VSPWHKKPKHTHDTPPHQPGPDGESFVELCEPNSAGVSRALQFIRDTYGAEHPPTKDAHSELVRIQALEETNAQNIPIHILLAKLAEVLSNLEAKLTHQADLMQQAKDQYEKAEKRIAYIAANTDDIEIEITARQKERDRLIAKSIPAGDIHAQELSLTVLTKFLNGAIGVEESATIIRLQEELAAIARKVRQGHTGPGSTHALDFARTPATEAASPQTVPGPLLGPPQFRDSTHRDLTHASQTTEQDLRQANQLHAASLLALTHTMGSSADSDPNTGNPPPPALLRDANIKEAAAHARKQLADKTNEAAKNALHRYLQQFDTNPNEDT
jgi:hypothetical protein